LKRHILESLGPHPGPLPEGEGTQERSLLLTLPGRPGTCGVEPAL